jgi:putative transcriptional regulator
MERNTLIEIVNKTLTAAQFEVSIMHSIRPMSFDLLARRNNLLLIIKVLTNIDALSEDAAKDLKTLSLLLEGSPLLVGERSSNSLLEDNVVYFRFGITTITSNTLKNYFLKNIPLAVYAAPGGLYVNLDEEKLRRAREEKNFSLGAFARAVGISRRMAKMYEEGANARLEVAKKIEKILGKKVISHINIQKEFEQSLVNKVDRNIGRFKIFQREVLTLIREIGYNIIPVEHCPFEAFSKERENILLTCINRFGDRFVRRARLVKDISKMTQQEAVLFTDKYKFKRNIEGIPVILKSELEKMKDPEDIIDLIIERKINGN